MNNSISGAYLHPGNISEQKWPFAPKFEVYVNGIKFAKQRPSMHELLFSIGNIIEPRHVIPNNVAF